MSSTDIINLPIFPPRRSNNCLCECGVCISCVSDIVFWNVVKAHMRIENCQCIFCAYHKYDLNVLPTDFPEPNPTIINFRSCRANNCECEC